MWLLYKFWRHRIPAALDRFRGRIIYAAWDQFRGCRIPAALDRFRGHIISVSLIFLLYFTVIGIFHDFATFSLNNLQKLLSIPCIGLVIGEFYLN